MFWRRKSRTLHASWLGLFIQIGLVDIGCAQLGPPPIVGPVTKCDAKLEYFSEVAPTRREPPFQLTNRIRNTDLKSVTDISWTKPEVFSLELIVGAQTENSYPISSYYRDKNAPIKIWYQGCIAPAEAYLLSAEGHKVDTVPDLSLRSLLRRFVEAKPETTESAEIVVSLRGESRTANGIPLSGFIQFDITRRPSDLRVGLTGIEPWLANNSANIAAASAREYGYTSVITKVSEVIKSEELSRLGGEWRFQTALFTQREGPGDSGFVRLRLPISSVNASSTRAIVILARRDGSFVTAGSYATFTPAR